MTRLPIDLSLKTVTTKVSVDAWLRAQTLKAKYTARLSDIVSVCLLHMPEAEIERLLQEQAAAVGKLPKAVRGVLSNMDRLSDDEREMLRDALK